jgi:uncharacterized protein (UPF0332 family)
LIKKEKHSEIVRYCLEKADESLASARREFEAGSFSFAMNRLYYAVFYAASALLMEHDRTFKKHSGVRAAFHQHFIKTGVLDPDWGRLMISFSRTDRKEIMWSSSPLKRNT